MKAIRRYGAVHNSGIMANPTYFLIDKQGIVQAWWPGKEGHVVPADSMLMAAQKIAEKL